MAETIDEFLIDFYKKKNNEDVSLDKIKTIKQTYGSDYDNLIRDLYSKYDSEGLDDNKLEVIKTTYNLSPKEETQNTIVEESSSISKEEDIKLPSEEIVEGVDEETSKGIEVYRNKLTNIMNSSFDEKQITKYELLGDKESYYIDYLDEARKYLKTKNEPTDYDSVKKQALKLYIKAEENNWKQEQYNQELENFETEFGVDRTEDLGSFIETVTQFSPIGPLKKAITGIRDVWQVGVQMSA